MKQGIINWQTGEPKEEGEYLVLVHGKRVMVDELYAYDEIKNGCVGKAYVWKHNWTISVTAWCKLSDIKPYKEEEL